jgi:hypothetical protein
MLPIEKVLSRLPNHKPSGKGFSACCPAHDDHNPSLSITEAKDGSVLLKCFAGCPAEQVVTAIGLQMADLFPTCHGTALRFTSPQEPATFATADEAIAACGLGKPGHQWPYVDAKGKEVLRVLRWNLRVGKTFRQISPSPNGWTKTGIPSPKPLLDLPRLLADAQGAVFVAEGEKCVDALTGLGLLATTSSGGCSAARLTDWSPLAGRDVVILPDNDDDGEGYAADVAAIISSLGATFRVVRFNELPPKGDLADLFEKCHDHGQRVELRKRIEQAAAQATLGTIADEPAENALAATPFPTDALPEIVRSVVVQAARSIGCEEAAVALPCLTGLGVASANWRVSIKKDWFAPPAVWTVIAAPSGQQKSPALDVTLDYFRSKQEALCQSHGPQPKKGEQEKPPTVWTDNATTEGLDDAFRRNPRGILYGCDELSGWLGTFGLYKNGRSAADEGWYCQRHHGRASNLVRKHNGPHVGCASGVLGITGCTTIETLKSLLTRSIRDCGMMARLVIYLAPARRRRWTDDVLPAEARENYYGLLDRLFAKEQLTIAKFSDGAAELFREFFKRHNEEAEASSSDELRAAFSKLEELPARLALILHVAGEEAGLISEEAMARAVRIAEWAKNETRRAYAILGSGLRSASATKPTGRTGLSSDDELRAWIKNRPNGVSLRDIRRTGPRKFRDRDVAEASLLRLAANGQVRRTDAGPTGTWCAAEDHDAADVDTAIPPAAAEPRPDATDQSEGDAAWTTIPRN